MSDADDYNKKQLDDGLLRPSHITVLAREFQKNHQLTADGKCGPKTRGEIEKQLGLPPTPDTFSLFYPLRTLADGRKPIITSAFQTESRPNHDGIDLFYVWKAGDKPDFVGDKGAAGKTSSGQPKYVVPYGETARAAGSGKVMLAGGSTTGFRAWIDHGNGLRTGYFHLLDLLVSDGQIIQPGTPIGLVGDNPADHDGRHLHFELSPVDRYAPMDPAPYLKLFLYNE